VRRPGKPVNFVPVIDADVRRWYKADSLWQSHDDRYDADAVLVIPGPEAVQGITRADEPVGELLGRFVRHGVERLQAAGQTPVDVPDTLDRAAIEAAAPAAGLQVSFGADAGLTAVATHDPGPAVALDRWLSALDPVVLAPMARKSAVLHGSQVAANPLELLLRVAKGDRWTATADAQGRLSALEIRRENGHGLDVALSRQGGVGRCEVTLIHALPADRQGRGAVAAAGRLTLAFEHDLQHGGRFPREVTPDRAARIGAFYRAAMIGETPPVRPGQELRTTFTVERSFVREYALAAGDGSVAHLGGRGRGHIMPLNAAFSAAFGAIFRVTHIGVAWDHARLVHLENEIRAFGPLPQDGETLEVTARLTAWEPTRGGVRIRTEAHLRAASDHALRGTITSVFFVQGETSPFRFRDETITHRLPAGDPALFDLLFDKAWARREAEPGADAAHSVALRLQTTTTAAGAEGRVNGALLDEAGRTVATLDWHGNMDAAESEPARWFAAFAPVARGRAPAPAPRPPTSSAPSPRGTSPSSPAPRATPTPCTATPTPPPSRASTAPSCTASGRPPAPSPRPSGLRRHGRRAHPRHLGELHRRGAARRRPGVARAPRRDGRAATCWWTSRPAGATPRRRRGPPHRAAGACASPRRARPTCSRARACRPRAWAWRATPAPPPPAASGTRPTPTAATASASRCSPWCATTPWRCGSGKEILRHEQGVLFLTQFTQVGMAVLAMRAGRRAARGRVLPGGRALLRPLVGEYSAIGALTDALSLTAVVECVYQRGLDDAALRAPRRAGPLALPHGRRAAQHRGHERGRPEGPRRPHRPRDGPALRGGEPQHPRPAVLRRGPRARARGPARRARRREPPGAKPSYLEVPGIDVPFHSVALRDGVAAFREKLEAYVPRGPRRDPLVGRYIPNLVARPFALTRSLPRRGGGCTGSES
jgi:hypothetical protein